MKNRFIQSLLISSAVSTTAFGQSIVDAAMPITEPSIQVKEEKVEKQAPIEQQTQQIKPLINKEKTDDFIRSLDALGRDTAIKDKDVKSGIRTVLDIKLPVIDTDCDIVVSHELLKIGYGVQANLAGSEKLLRSVAENLYEKTSRQLKGITPQCHKALRSFSTSVLKIYLGSDWSGDEPTKVKKEEVIETKRETPFNRDN